MWGEAFENALLRHSAALNVNELLSTLRCKKSCSLLNMASIEFLHCVTRNNQKLLMHYNFAIGMLKNEF